MNQHLQESQNKYDSHTNPTILGRMLCVCLFLSFFFVNAATIKTLNFDEFESSESFMSIINL